MLNDAKCSDGWIDDARTREEIPSPQSVDQKTHLHERANNFFSQHSFHPEEHQLNPWWSRLKNFLFLDPGRNSVCFHFTLSATVFFVCPSAIETKLRRELHGHGKCPHNFWIAGETNYCALTIVKFEIFSSALHARGR